MARTLTAQIDKIRQILHPYKDCSGKFLYSAYETLALGDLYFLGINPGGTIHNDPSEVIGSSLELLPGRIKNEFLDDTWRGKKPGTSTLQKRVQKLIQGIGYDIRSVCASNLIFIRSKNLTNLENFNQLCQACWPVHELIITEIVKPKVILTMGTDKKSASGFLYERHYKKFKEDAELTLFASGHGRTRCQYFRTVVNDHPLLVIAVPHLSRHNLSDPAIDHIRSLVEAEL